MIVNATEMKNNFGKYLRMAAKEDIIITSNGKKVARLTDYVKDYAPDWRGGRIREGSVAYEIPPRKMSYEEFLEIRDSTEQRLEYIDGEVYLLSSPKTNHQIALGELYSIFYSFFNGKKCKPMLAPYDITLRRKKGGINMVQPDLTVICDLEEKLNEQGYYTGVPALIVEILSDGTRKNDLVKKLDLYMDAGVHEYWIVDPENRQVTVYLLEDDNISKHATFKGQEIALSYVFEGLAVQADSLFKF